MNYNSLALQGFEIDDMEFVKEFELDPKLAYTKGLNFAMLDNVYAKNVSGFIDRGMPRDKARAEAGRLRAKAKRQIMELLPK